MLREYAAPEVKLVGQADEVILGAMTVGLDYFSQHLDHRMEFAEDDRTSMPAR